MLTITNKLQTVGGRMACGALAVMCFLVGSTSGQNVSGYQVPTKTQSAEKAVVLTLQPVSSIYKEVKIGTDAEQVRSLLGKATIDDKDGFFYEMDSEIVQIRLDKAAKVRIILVTYPSTSPNVPKYADIFGSDTAVAKPDGSVYQLIRYPEAGYWIAYSKTSGDKPSVTVTMQKL